MINYIYDAIRVSNGGNNFVALSLTDDDGKVIATGDLTMEICYGGKTVRAVVAKYTSNTWFFEIPDDLDFVVRSSLDDLIKTYNSKYIIFNSRVNLLDEVSIG